MSFYHRLCLGVFSFDLGGPVLVGAVSDAGHLNSGCLIDMDLRSMSGRARAPEVR